MKRLADAESEDNGGELKRRRGDEVLYGQVVSASISNSCVKAQKGGGTIAFFLRLPDCFWFC